MADSAIRETTIGPIPQDWDLVRLGDVTIEGTERNRHLALERDDVLSVDNVRGLVPSDRLLGDDFSRYKLVQKKQLAYNPMRLNVGSIGLWRDEKVGIVSPDYIVFGCDDERLDADFLDLFRNSAAWDWQIQQSGQGSIRIRYYYRHIAEFLVPLPPLPEQQVIAHILRTVQRAKETIENNLAASRRLKQSLMRHLFTYGPVPLDQADSVRLKDTEIGTVPDHWQVVSLGSLARIGNGSTPKRDNSLYWEKGTIPWLNSGKVHESVIDHADQFVTETAQRECHLPLVNKGSLVVAITGQGKTLGNTALVTFDTCVSQHLAYVQFHSPDVVPVFMLSFLQGRYAHLREIGQSGGSTKGALTCGFLKGYTVPLPPSQDQHQIASILESVSRKLEVEETRLQSLDTLFKTLLHHLMTGKVRVGDFALA